MDSIGLVCVSCGFVNPAAWRACAKCGHPLGNASHLEGRTYMLSLGEATELQDSDLMELPEPGLEEPGNEAAESRPPTVSDEIEPPLVGQGEAVTAIQAGVEHAFDTQKATLVVLEGERGSGKTRLLFHASEVAAQRSAKVRVWHGACRTKGDADAYAPFGRILLHRFGVAPASSPSQVRVQMMTTVEAVLPDAEAVEAAEVTHLLGFAAGVPFPDSPFLRRNEEPEQLRARVTDALTRFIAAEAETNPLLILLDDMHLAHEHAWNMVEAIASIDGPIAMVISGAAPVAKRADAIEAPGGTAIGPIAPLDHADVSQFLKVFLPTLLTTPEPLVAAMLHRSGGNPSALRELLLALVEARFFKRTPDGYVADMVRLKSDELPVSMEDAIRARLSSLDSWEHATLARASVAGEHFPERCLIAMMRAERPEPARASDPTAYWSDDDDEVALQDALERLERKGFIQTLDQADFPDQREFRFLHPGTRDLVYREMDPELRSARHHTMAHWHSLLSDLNRPGLAARAARHYEKAGMRNRAGQAHLLAARDESAKRHTQSALRHAERALELLDGDDLVRRLDAHHTLGALHTTVGNYEDAQTSFSAMLRLSWRVGARNKGGAALNRLARIERQRGQHEKATGLLERALGLFRAAGDLRGVASTLDDLAQNARLSGELQRASVAATEALEIRQSYQDHRGEAVSFMTLGTIALSRGELRAAEEYFVRARELREALGERGGLVQVLNALGVVSYDRGDLERAEAFWRASLQEARKMADRPTQSMLLNNLGEALASSGKLAPSEALLREARVIAHALDDRRMMAEIERNLGLTLMRMGAEDAGDTLYRALTLAEAYGAKEAIGLAHRAIGDLRAQTLFDADNKVNRDAEESFLASIDLLREVGNEKEAARSLAALGFHYAERGDLELAKERLREARAVMRRIEDGQLERIEQALLEFGG